MESQSQTCSVSAQSDTTGHTSTWVCVWVCVYMRATWKLLFNTTLLQPTNFNFPPNLSLQLRNIFLDCLEFPLTYHIGWVCRTQNVLHVHFPWKLSHQHVTYFKLRQVQKLPLSVFCNLSSCSIPADDFNGHKTMKILHITWKVTN